MTVYEKLQLCTACVRKKTDFVPRFALVLGSGLGGYARNIDIAAVVDYSAIEGFPVSTVSGHKGRFVFGYVGEVPVVCMQGRVHYYEGYDMSDVVLPIRLMRMLGAQTLLLTNAAGGINADFTAGDLMLLEDQISCFVPSPLVGENVDEFGVRFPDMSEIYDKSLRELILQVAGEQHISLRRGVYVQTQGPNYESPAEIAMLRTLGADAVGMSTACEAVAANHMGMRIAGISCISNMAAGILGMPLTHAEVQKAADAVAPKLEQLVTGVLQRCGKAL